jgi:transcriptional regulator with XRE-family HTH domain
VADAGIDREEMLRHVRLFGQAVAKTRGERGMSREKLAGKSGIGLRMLERIETGTARPDGFGLDEICKIARALRLRPYQLMERYEALLNGKRG